MRIVRLANFVAPHSGGLRTSLRELGAGYLAAGHEPVLIIPGRRDSDEQTEQGRVITLHGPRVPFTGGYRVLLRKRQVAALLDRAAAGRARGVGPGHAALDRALGARHGVPAAMVSHESLTALLAHDAGRAGQPGWPRPSPTALNRRTARAYQQVICTTGWAAAEFERIGAGNVVRAPLGVDLDTFSPPAQRAGPGLLRRRRERCSWCTAAGCPRRRSRSAH